MQQDLAGDPFNGYWKEGALAASHVLIYLPAVCGAHHRPDDDFKYSEPAYRQSLFQRAQIHRSVVMMTVLILFLIVAHRYILGVGCLAYAFMGLASLAWARMRPRAAKPATSI